MYVVYGFSECEYCQKAKALLEESDIEYEFHEVPGSKRRFFLESRGFSGSELTYPKIWEGERLVGGYVDLEAEIAL